MFLRNAAWQNKLLIIGFSLYNDIRKNKRSKLKETGYSIVSKLVF
jgi:hypothetical protein